jgi:HAD superfamily hydrolase (TIGR01509 family)
MIRVQHEKAIIFDLNGVFIISPRLSDRFKDDFSVPTSEFLPVLTEIMDKVRRPKASNIYDLWVPYLAKWNIKLSKNEFLDYWFNVERKNVDLTDLIRKLKGKGIKIIILSNNFKERTDYYNKTFPFINELFDGIYYSWQTGFVKPDIRAFEVILKNNDLKPEDCLYFDDTEKNISLANSIGIKSHIFNDDTIDLLNSLFL